MSVQSIVLLMTGRSKSVDKISGHEYYCWLFRFPASQHVMQSYPSMLTDRLDRRPQAIQKTNGRSKVGNNSLPLTHISENKTMSVRTRIGAHAIIHCTILPTLITPTPAARNQAKSMRLTIRVLDLWLDSWSGWNRHYSSILMSVRGMLAVHCKHNLHTIHRTSSKDIVPLSVERSAAAVTLESNNALQSIWSFLWCIIQSNESGTWFVTCASTPKWQIGRRKKRCTNLREAMISWSLWLSDMLYYCTSIYAKRALFTK